MTAYEQGFMAKCAEYDIDGQAMLAAMAKQAEWMEKKAQIAKLFGSLASKAGKYGRQGLAAAQRYGRRGMELLRGGNAGILDPYRRNLEHLQTGLQNLDPNHKMFKAWQGSYMKGLKDLANAATGAGPAYAGKFGTVGAGVGKELAKVRNARIGAGAAGTVGLGLLANGIHSKMGPDVNDTDYFDYKPVKMAADDGKAIKKDLESTKSNLSDILERVHGKLKGYKDFVSSDYANNALVPGLVGAGVGGLASKYLDPTEDPRKRKRNRAILTLLGLTGGMALKYKGKLDSLPKVQAGDGSITVSK